MSSIFIYGCDFIGFFYFSVIMRMRKLLIVANPNPKSFSHAMLQKYLENSQIAGHDCKVLDLYIMRQSYLDYTSVSHDDEKVIISLQDDIVWADELVFFFPVWWWTFPAILKNYFDTVFSAWFAFNYEQHSLRPKKLLLGKQAKVFCTCDAPWFIYKISFFSWINIRKYLSKTIFWICGIKLKKFILYSRLKFRTEKEKEKILQSIE